MRHLFFKHRYLLYPRLLKKQMRSLLRLTIKINRDDCSHRSKNCIALALKRLRRNTSMILHVTIKVAAEVEGAEAEAGQVGERPMESAQVGATDRHGFGVGVWRLTRVAAATAAEVV